MPLNSNYQEDILEALVNYNDTYQVSFAQNAYIGLFTVMPSTDTLTGGTEVSGNGYMRLKLKDTVLGTTYFGSAASTQSGVSSIKNSGAIMFPIATAAWGTVVGFGIFDASSGGNCLLAGSLTASQAIAANDVAVFTANNLTISLQPQTSSAS